MGYRGHKSHDETDKFFEYLKEDHIDGVADKVDKRKTEQKERYSRYVKCLLQSENVFTDNLYKKITGQEFEIILLQNPYTLHIGDKLSAQVFFHGKPVASKTITARNRIGNESATVQKAVTDKNGICQFTLTRKGEWFLHATYMIPCPDKQDSDWESFWTSYSFAVE